MRTEAETQRYTRVAIILHWLIAALILYNLASGLLRPVLPKGFFVFHISSGISILALTLVRIVWRLTHRPPAFLPMKAWEAKLAHGVHFLLYFAMLALPLSGWAMISANPPAGSPGAAQMDAIKAAKAQASGHADAGHKPNHGPRLIWGLIPLPSIAPIQNIGVTPDGAMQQAELHEKIETAHLLGGWAMFLLLILHIAGALKHQFADREPELARMGLGSTKRETELEPV